MDKLLTILFLVGFIFNCHAQEVCNNGADDDANGLTDCQEPSCQFAQSNNYCNCTNTNILWYIDNNQALFRVDLGTGQETNLGQRTSTPNALYMDLAWSSRGFLYVLAVSPTSLTIRSISSNLGLSSAVIEGTLTTLSSSTAMVGGMDNSLYIIGESSSDPNSTLLVKYDLNAVTNRETVIGRYARFQCDDLTFVGEYLYGVTTAGMIRIDMRNPTVAVHLTNTCTNNGFGLTSDKQGNMYSCVQSTVLRVDDPNLVNGCTPILGLSSIPMGFSMYGDIGQGLASLPPEGIEESITGSTTISPAILPSQSQFTYLWSNGQTTPSISVSPLQTTSYCLTVTDPIGSCSSINCTSLSVFNLYTIFDIKNVWKGMSTSGNVLVNDDYYQNNQAISSITLEEPPVFGAVNFASNGNYTYIPYPAYVGKDTFYYKLSSTLPNGSNLAVITSSTANVIPSNSNNLPPQTHEDISRTFANLPVTGNVLNNDIEIDEEAMTVSLATPPSRGSVVLNNDGSYTFTPGLNHTGQDGFRYRVCDQSGNCSEERVKIFITVDRNGPFFDAPFAQDDAFLTQFNTALTGNLGGNDFDPNNGMLVFSQLTVPSTANGFVTVNPNGTFTYTPNAGFWGSDNFGYIICNGFALCDTAVCHILVAEQDCDPFFEYVVNPFMPPWTVFGDHSITAASFLWDFGDGNASTDPRPIHYYSSTGFYNVCLTTIDFNGCVGRFCDSLGVDALGNIYINGVGAQGFVLSFRPMTTSVENQHSLGAISAHPNPTNGNVTIDLGLASSEETDFEVRDLLGRTLSGVSMLGRDEHHFTIDLSDFPSGAYVLHLRQGDLATAIKIIKH